jgi:hypothetical protein
MMKKQYAQIIILAILLLSLVGSIMRCQQRGDAPSKENIESAEEASRQVPEQGPAPEMKRIESADSVETVDSALQVQTARRYFEALMKMADGGKVYATDADGQRIPKAFTNFDDYIQFITDNPQYPKNHFSYDSGGKPCYINANPLPNGDGVLE